MKAWQFASKVGARISTKMPRLGAPLQLMAHRRIGELELNHMRELADREKIALDIGANWGPYTGALRGHCKAVIAFEPNPNLAKMLARAWPGIRVERCALSDRDGVAILRMPVTATGQMLPGFASIVDDPAFTNFVEQQVPMHKLDDFKLENVGFIKIDIEGHEIAAVRGGWDTISRDRPVMLIESQSEHAVGCPDALVDLLATLGYEASFLHEGKFKPFSDWSPNLRATNYDGPINNFIFRANR
ncbi:FkbM family methyltransferase [Sphingomonas sp. So64.6b]|uniref:FkbM family methyltransferase n=1 Tax=Sphingomonas sp. So64.6b TaxID=2997354 RepID=UPI0016049B51|nr:FkbM family methyltransferase [Sphingomonas sp. So64.6b]QNA85138.1 FkbM family methyltransferase [Sphingomonas sp. So64.6b]